MIQPDTGWEITSQGKFLRHVVCSVPQLNNPRVTRYICARTPVHIQVQVQSIGRRTGLRVRPFFNDPTMWVATLRLCEGLYLYYDAICGTCMVCFGTEQLCDGGSCHRAIVPCIQAETPWGQSA